MPLVNVKINPDESRSGHQKALVIRFLAIMPKLFF